MRDGRSSARTVVLDQPRAQVNAEGRLERLELSLELAEAAALLPPAAARLGAPRGRVAHRRGRGRGAPLAPLDGRAEANKNQVCSPESSEIQFGVLGEFL